MIEWDTTQYNLFLTERVQPNEDLIAQIQSEPEWIVDMGCGAGDCSTLALRKRYPDAQIWAIDSSAELIEAARLKQPAANIHWRTGHIETFETSQEVDLIYLGASFQWVADHRQHVPRLVRTLSANGTLAMQMPNMFHQPFYTSILAVAEQSAWESALHGKLRRAPVLDADEYASILAPLDVTARIWTSTYEVRFASVEGLVAWAKGAPLRPVGTLLDAPSFELFCEAYAGHLARHYRNDDGSWTLPFERIFIIASH